MKISADEGADCPRMERLRPNGHQVWHVAEMEPGIAGEALPEPADREGVVLLTVDKDFGELVFRREWMTKGVIAHSIGRYLSGP